MCVCICTHAHTMIYIHIYIFSFSGVQAREQIHCLVGWLSETPHGLIYLIDNPTGTGFAAIASDTPVCLHGFLDVRIVFLPSTCCSFSYPGLKLVSPSAQGPAALTAPAALGRTRPRPPLHSPSRSSSPFSSSPALFGFPCRLALHQSL